MSFTTSCLELWEGLRTLLTQWKNFKLLKVMFTALWTSSVQWETLAQKDDDWEVWGLDERS